VRVQLNHTIAALAALAMASASWADLSFGGSREQGMAGAGFAFPTSAGGRGFRNPALLALRPSVRFFWPRFDFTSRGVGFGDLDDLVEFGSNGVLDTDKLGQFARTFGDETAEFGLGSSLGFQIGAYNVDFGGQAVGATVPNAALQNWVNSGANLLNLPADAQLDAYGLGLYEIGVGTGKVISNPLDSRVAVGARAKLVRAYYTHYLANAANIANGTSTAGAELGGADYLSDAGFGLDAGIHLTPQGQSGLYAGFIINNLIAPEVRFNALTPGTAPAMDSVYAFARTVDGGVGFQSGQILFAGDFVDLFNSAGRQDIRFGGEYLLGGQFAIRAGLSANEGLTLGAGLGALNFAFGGRMPLEAGYAIRF
jgi:hypothetical protein